MRVKHQVFSPAGFENSQVKKPTRASGLWQPRFWEHQIRSEQDFSQHVNYIHYNPVKHGLVQRVIDWPHSSFSSWVERGVYQKDWAGGGGDNNDYGE